MSRADRFFRRLLRLFPADFRGDFGDEMAATFRDQRRDALAERGSMGALRLWWDTLRGIVATAPREHLEVLRGDVGYALRTLRRQTGFTLVAVLALAIGIGANSAVFSVINGVLLEAFPYKDPRGLVLLFEQLPNAPFKFGFSPPDFEIVRELARSYTGLAAYRTMGYELSGLATPQRVSGARVSPELFSVLGVGPAIGRGLTGEDDRQNARVAVVSHNLWTQSFGRDPFLVGRSITLDGRPYTVVGIMPERFVFPPRGAHLNGESADVFVPMSFLPFERQAFGTQYNNTVVARLSPGVSIDQARAEGSRLVPPLTDRYPPMLQRLTAKMSIPVVSLYEETVGGSRRLLVVLMGAVGLVLLIACADVASLILTRSTSRQRELGIRSALGASGPRIVRQLLTEAFVLAAAGSAMGLLLAYSLMRGLLSLAGDKLPRTESIAFDRRIVVFTLVLAIITPLVFGAVPAIRAARATNGNALKEGARTRTSGRQRPSLLGSLVVGQFAVALVLSVGAALLVRSFIRLLHTDPGFRPEQAIRATVTLPVGRYGTPQQVKAFYQRSIDAARTISGVASIGAGSDLPLGVRDRRAFSADPSAQPIPPESRLIPPTWTAGGYFDALGIPLLRGRFFIDADEPSRQRVVIVNDRLARLLWPDADPVGHRIRWGADIAENQNPWMTIVGVVGNVKQGGLDMASMPQLYAPLAQEDAGGPLLRTVNLVARSTRDPASLMVDVRGVLQQLDTALPATLQTLDDMIGATVQPQRFSLTAMALFAGLALTLAALGIYGVLANAVAQQTREIGVRVALGAARSDIMWLVLRRALTLLGIGLAIGAAGALAATRTMAGLLFEVQPTDVTSFLGAAVGLAAVALVASLAPAWRATRVDPLVALRTE
jgi:putative ABC transport system permease protein